MNDDGFALFLRRIGRTPLLWDNWTNTDTAGSAGGSGAQELSGDLVGAGASSQQAAMEAWQAGFQGEYPDVQFSYDPVGSGGGREQFIDGATDFAGSDAAMDEEEMTQAEEVCGPEGVFHVPAYISPVAVAVNLEGASSLSQSSA